MFELSNPACLQHEAILTRVLLGKSAVNKTSWSPPSSTRSIGTLAAHLAELPRWTLSILENPYYDFAEAAVRDLERSRRGGPVPAASREELLSTFDANVQAALDALEAVSEETITAPWQLRRAGKVIETFPRSSAIRRFVIDHMIHHRGQLTVYLRMLGVSVPGLYGPSADEPYIGEVLPTEIA
jgi:uncharacterized damage-inducible protein DinB